jgi:hypothetical protein
VVDAGTSEERVEGGAIVGKEVTADVVAQGLASATKLNTSVSRGSEPPKEIGRATPE